VFKGAGMLGPIRFIQVMIPLFLTENVKKREQGGEITALF